VIVRGISQTNSEAALAGYLEYAPVGSLFSAVKPARRTVDDVAQVEESGERGGAVALGLSSAPVSDLGPLGLMVSRGRSGRSQARRLRRRRIYARRLGSFLARLNSTTRLRPSLYAWNRRLVRWRLITLRP